MTHLSASSPVTVMAVALLMILSTACGDRKADGKVDNPIRKTVEPAGKADKGGKADSRKSADKKHAGKKPSDKKAPAKTAAATETPASATSPSGTEPAAAPGTNPPGRIDSAAQPKTVDAAVPAPEKQPEAQNAARSDPSRPPLADPRLLLTMVDVSKIAPPKARFRRAVLAGMPRTEDSDSIMYAPEKGSSFGFSLQLFRTRNAQETRKRYDALQASYPNSQEISSVSGKTFFSYWDEVMHIAFVHPAKNMVVVVSCGRSYCNSNQLMELAGTISERLR